MAGITGGVVVTGPISPTATSNIYPTHDSIYGKGGWREVGSTGEMYSISDERKSIGMAVSVTSNNKVYILNPGIGNNNWIEFIGGAGGTTGPTGATGFAGPTGATGATGATGVQGLTGPQGATAFPGPNTLIYKKGITGDTEGTWGINASYLGDVTAVYINKTSMDGYTGITGTTYGASGWLAGITVNSVLQLYASSGKFGLFRVTSSNNNLIKFTFGVTGINSTYQATVNNEDLTAISYSAPGPSGADGQVTPSGLNWKGAWSPATGYVINDTVGYNGASWWCIEPILANQLNPGPTGGSLNWALLAAQGAQGVPGGQGSPGGQGDKGDKGSTGPTGSAGPTGATSMVPGPTGPTGSVGPTGATGATSMVPGPTGPTGPTGSVGPTGATGATSMVPGPTGPTGPTGPIGVTGSINKSIKLVTGNTYPLIASDTDSILHFTYGDGSNTPITLTVSVNLPTNYRYEGRQMGTSQVGITGAVGVTIRTALSELPKTAEQYSVFAIDYLSNNEYLVYGKLAIL
jgi:hypothetical protein